MYYVLMIDERIQLLAFLVWCGVVWHGPSFRPTRDWAPDFRSESASFTQTLNQASQMVPGSWVLVWNVECGMQSLHGIPIPSATWYAMKTERKKGVGWAQRAYIQRMKGVLGAEGLHSACPSPSPTRRSRRCRKKQCSQRRRRTSGRCPWATPGNLAQNVTKEVSTAAQDGSQ